jgi:hypothetical protein
LPDKHSSTCAIPQVQDTWIVRWQNRSFLHVTPWMRRVRVQGWILFQRERERKSIRNFKRGTRMAEKPLRNRKVTREKLGNSP